MKTITLLLLITYSVIGNTQISYDRNLEIHLAGQWTHVKSTYPSGNQETYIRIFDLYSDSTFEVQYISKVDTSYKTGVWFVKDTCVNLFEVVLQEDYTTRLLLEDVQYIRHLSEYHFTLVKRYGEEILRKETMYKRLK